ncbi:MAG: DUF58 domain-containing protein [Nitrososphaerales archaeon]
MRSTKRGRDYLKASIATAIISSILDVRITLALALSLLIAALVSQLLLGTASVKNMSIEIDEPSLAIFKGETVTETVRIISHRRRFVDVQLDSINGPAGVEASIVSESSDSMVFSFKPAYAGRFEGFTAIFTFSDPLSLFRKRMKFERLDFVLDSFPKSLLSETRAVRPVSLSLGERTGRTSGFGQEFYAIDDYRPSSEKRSIYWKKVARMPDDKLVIKIRESNIPKTMKIGVIRTSQREIEDSIIFLDIVAEGAAMLGKILLSIGCNVELLYHRDGSVLTALASDLSELSHAIVEMSTCEVASSEDVFSIIVDSDICITGFKELGSPKFAEVISTKPSLIVKEEGANPATIGELALIFSGSEDVGRIVNEVVGK